MSAKINTELIEEIQVTRLPYRFYIPDAKEELYSICYAGAYEKYGNPLPEQIENRLQEELQAIGKHNLESMYLLPIKLAKKCKELNSMLLTRGCAGNSLILYLGGLAIVNPLPPHYYCPVCKLTEFVAETTCKSGLDLIPLQKEKTCPKCGAKLTGDGNRLNYEFLSGADGSKLPDMEFIIDIAYQQELVSYLQTFIPEDPNLQIANNEFYLTLITSPHISLLKKLEATTEVLAQDIDISQVNLSNFFSKGNLDGILSDTEIIQMCQPKCFSDLVTAYGWKYGLRTSDKQISLDDAFQGAFVLQDDIMTQLFDAGIGKPDAFRISEFVRKGRGEQLPEELIQLMLSHHIPQKQIDDMKTILCLFPKAHITGYLLIACKLFWYKTFYPTEFKTAIPKEVW